MESDRFIKENEFGKLVERKIDGEIKNVFIISEDAFWQAYNAHQKWYEKFKDKLYDEYGKPVYIYSLDKILQKELLDKSDLECRRYNHENFMPIRASIIFSYEKIHNLFECNLPFSSLWFAYFKNTNLYNVHLEGADLNHANFEAAYFGNVKLKGAFLHFANLKEARLNNADYKYSDLKHSNLKGADLLNTNFEGASLNDVNFKGANLSNATLYSEELREIDTGTKKVISDKNIYKHRGISLQGTKLHNVNLSHIEGLTAKQIAGADLTNAKLPENLNNLTEVTKPINEAIKSNGTLFSIIITIMVIIFLLSLSTDVKQANDIVKTVSVLGTEIDFTRNMLWIVPIGLYIVFLSFCMNLSNFWRLLGTMPAIFPDGRYLPEVIDHWIPTSCLYLFYSKLSDNFNLKDFKENIRMYFRKDVKIPFKKRIKWCYISIREHFYDLMTRLNIYIQAGFSLAILYFPIPLLIIFFCWKFNLYLINNSWLTIVVIILTGFTLAFYIIDMVKTLKK